MNKNKIKKWTDYFLLFFLIATTGFPFFYSDIEFVILGFLLSFFIFINRNLKFNSNFIFVIISFFIIEVAQILYFNTFEPLTLAGTYIRLGFAFFVARILEQKFFDYFFNTIYFFSVISLIFYIPSIINPSFATFIVNNIAILFKSPFGSNINTIYEISPNIIIYVFEKSLFVSQRNSGPFWEPGAFSIFIILALIFNFIKEHKIITFKNIILILTVLTTTSTSGYIALFLLVVLHYLLNQKVNASKYGIVMILIYGASLLYIQLEFLGEKATNDIALASDTTTSRFGSALVDLRDFSENPIVGYGRGQNRYGGKEVLLFSVEQHRNNGLTQLLVSYGIYIFIMYFYLYYKNLKKYIVFQGFNKKFIVAVMLIIFILGFSQGVFTRSFFYSLLFLIIPDVKKIDKNVV